MARNARSAPISTPDKVSWGPLRALGALLGSFLLAGSLGVFLPAPAASLLLGALFLGTSWLVAGSWPALGFRQPLAGWPLLVFSGYMVFWMGSVVWTLLMPEAEQKDIASPLGSLPVQIFLIVLVAPLAEEVVFRGLLFQGFLQRMSLPLAVILSSLLFALPHFPGGLLTLPLLFIFGAVLALLYWRTESIWPPILLHALNNALALVVIS